MKFFKVLNILIDELCMKMDNRSVLSKISGQMTVKMSKDTRGLWTIRKSTMFLAKRQKIIEKEKKVTTNEKC